MAVPISSFLQKASGSIPFLMRDTDLRGGFRVVEDHDGLLEIHVGARAIGMLVYVISDSSYLQWSGTDWVTWDITSLINTGNGLTVEEGTLSVNHEEVQQALAEHFAAAEHNHDEQYAAKDHSHEGYASSEHNHDEQYAAKDHSHDEQYAAKDHSHDEQYAAKDHSHEGYASSDHKHTFSSLTEVPKVSAMPGVTITDREPGPEDGEDGDIWFVIAE